MTKPTSTDIAAALYDFVRRTASLVSALVVIGAALWFPVTAFLEEREEPIIDRLDGIDKSIQALQRLVNVGQTPYIEFMGSGVVASDQPVKQGGVVRIIYNLRRNIPCRTTVQVRFISAVTTSIESSWTYEIPATQAPVTVGFATFPVSVRLPDDLPPGRWAYSPLLIPEDCNGAENVLPPISEFFQVIQK